MLDLKNLLLAWLSVMTCFTAAIETQTLVSIVSAIVLPVLFFSVGKFLDLALQFHLAKRKTEGNSKDR